MIAVGPKRTTFKRNKAPLYQIILFFLFIIYILLSFTIYSQLPGASRVYTMLENYLENSHENYQKDNIFFY